METLGAPGHWLMIDVFFVSYLHLWTGLAVLLVGVVALAIWAALAPDGSKEQEEVWSWLIFVVPTALLWPLAAFLALYVGTVVLAVWGVGYGVYRATQAIAGTRVVEDKYSDELDEWDADYGVGMDPEWGTTRERTLGDNPW